MLYKNVSLKGKLAAYQESGHVTKTTNMGKDKRHDVPEEEGGSRRQEEEVGLQL